MGADKFAAKYHKCTKIYLPKMSAQAQKFNTIKGTRNFWITKNLRIRVLGKIRHEQLNTFGKPIIQKGLQN